MEPQPFLRALLEHLDGNRRLPKYQYERRIDAFISFFLQPVLRAKGVLREDAIQLAEFPIHAQTGKGDHSDNADFLLFEPGSRRATFVELKTDGGSANDGQFLYYSRAMSTPWPELTGFVKRLTTKRKSGVKYKVLWSELEPCSECTARAFVCVAPASASRGFAFHAAQAQSAGAAPDSWIFLPLREFARTDIVGPYSAEWEVVREYIDRIESI